MRPTAAPARFPYDEHRTMAQVLEVEQRIGAQRDHERDWHREYRKRRKAAA